MEKATYQHCGSKKDNNSPRSDIESEKDRFQPWFAQAVGILWCPLCSKKLEKKGWYEFHTSLKQYLPKNSTALEHP